MPSRPILLVAEDSISDQLLLRRAIQKVGLDVQPEFVCDGLEAVQYLQQHNPQLPPAALLLDLRMPRMDGLEVLEWLRQHPAVRPAYVVVLTSSCGEADLARSHKLGVDHYLVKPADPVELAATMKRLEPYWSSAPVASPEPVETTLQEQLALAP